LPPGRYGAHNKSDILLVSSTLADCGSRTDAAPVATRCPLPSLVCRDAVER